MQYNVHKLKNKIIITLLNERNARNYNILIIQKSWRLYEKARTCSFRNIDFVLKDNKERIYFYINDRINSNNWHNIWHLKNVNIINLQLQQCESETQENLKYTYNIKSMNVHKVYNLLSVSHNKILQRKSFLFENRQCTCKAKTL